ncbi:hypothetical protein [Mesobacterium pallidum]|uniref:hypothetical protein n=1 Tax=Mesobacterium pallidum TaxID=2872037 RepID=UPI001EE241F7|nr:hypothetical protein [Mesobacterium pallidum]
MSKTSDIPPRRLFMALAGAALAGAFGTWITGLGAAWPALLVPLSLALFAAVWAGSTPRELRRALPWILAGLVGVQLALWLPLILAFYVQGGGAAQLGHAVGAALVTTLAVGWYVGTQHWGLALATLALAAVLLTWRRMGQKEP